MAIYRIQYINPLYPYLEQGLEVESCRVFDTTREMKRKLNEWIFFLLYKKKGRKERKKDVNCKWRVQREKKEEEKENQN